MPGQIPFHLVAIQVARTHPSIFDRLDHHVASTYVISPNNMPVVLVLKPQREAPKLTVRYRDNAPTGDAYIAGPLPVLFDLLDQRVDGDALFFSRDLHISGDTEAIVCLRNALDDQPHPITETVSRVFGPAGRHALMRIRKERYGDAGTA